MPRCLPRLPPFSRWVTPAAAQQFEGRFFTQSLTRRTVSTGTVALMPGEAPPDGRRAVILLRCAHPMRAGAGPPMRVSLEDAEQQVGRLPEACARVVPGR